MIASARRLVVGSLAALCASLVPASSHAQTPPRPSPEQAAALLQANPDFVRQMRERFEASGMTENGWIPVDRTNLKTRFPGVYAIGDVNSVGTAKAGVFAEGAARARASSAAVNASSTSASSFS